MSRDATSRAGVLRLRLDAHRPAPPARCAATDRRSSMAQGPRRDYECGGAYTHKPSIQEPQRILLRLDQGPRPVGVSARRPTCRSRSLLRNRGFRRTARCISGVIGPPRYDRAARPMPGETTRRRAVPRLSGCDGALARDAQLQNGIFGKAATVLGPPAKPRPVHHIRNTPTPLSRKAIRSSSGSLSSRIARSASLGPWWYRYQKS